MTAKWIPEGFSLAASQDMTHLGKAIFLMNAVGPYHWQAR